MCPHQPHAHRLTAQTATPPTPWPFTPGQRWSPLCDGVIVPSGLGEILPGGRVMPPHRPAPNCGFPLPRENTGGTNAYRYCGLAPWFHGTDSAA